MLGMNLQRHRSICRGTTEIDFHPRTWVLDSVAARVDVVIRALKDLMAAADITVELSWQPSKKEEAKTPPV